MCRLFEFFVFNPGFTKHRHSFLLFTAYTDFRRSHAGYACTYDWTEIYRRSHAGYACTYDWTEIYRRRLAGYASYLRLYRNLSS